MRCHRSAWPRPCSPARVGLDFTLTGEIVVIDREKFTAWADDDQAA
jgi:hypothetical protein